MYIQRDVCMYIHMEGCMHTYALNMHVLSAEISRCVCM